MAAGYESLNNVLFIGEVVMGSRRAGALWSQISSRFERAWWSIEVALWGASPVLLLRLLAPSLPGKVLLATYFVAVAAILALHVIIWRRQAIRARRRNDGPCTNCGYSLRGLTVPRCPECGTPCILPRSSRSTGAA